MMLTERRQKKTPETDANVTGNLLLTDLVVRNFRGLREIDVSRLGRVALITGMNGIGKTTVLDAIHLYALGGRHSAISGLLKRRREYARLHDDDSGDKMGIDLGALFYGRTVTSESRIVIGESSPAHQLVIEVQDAADEQLDMFELVDPDSVMTGRKILTTRFCGNSLPLPWVFSTRVDPVAVEDAPSNWYRRYRQVSKSFEEIPEIPHVVIGPGLPRDQALASSWDNVALTPDEDNVLEALSLVLGDDITRVAFVGDARSKDISGRRRCIVNLKSHLRPVPLQSLGDGALRLMRLSLALAVAKDGLLLIDEIENGIHYSVQSNMWRMIFRIADQNNVQVVATTHSSDCVTAFADAAVENVDVDGALVRLNSHEGILYSDAYSEGRVAKANQHLIDLR